MAMVGGILMRFISISSPLNPMSDAIGAATD